MQCRDLEVVVEQQGLEPLSEAARQHLAQCSACTHYIADLNSIVATAHELPAEVEPPERIWISLRAQLQNEGVIHEQARSREASPAWWPSFADLFRKRAFAMAAVGALIVIAAASQFQKPRVQVLEPRDNGFDSTVSVLRQQEHDLANMQLASTGGSSGYTSAVDTSLRQNLQQVDEFIADCERRLKEQPSDELAREYLTNAYQQKAQLLSVMMDRGGSLN
jgi:anti-sigma factor RsiW